MKYSTHNQFIQAHLKFTLATILTTSLCADANAAIRYFAGPRISLPVFAGPTDLDLNWDGKSDVQFKGVTTCTNGNFDPCRTYLAITPQVGAEILSTTNYLATIPFGATIGAAAPVPSEWTTNDIVVVEQAIPGLVIPLESPFQIAEKGYAGIRFKDADGIHYGWIGLTVQTLVPFEPVYLTPMDFDLVATNKLELQGTVRIYPPTASEIYVISGPIVNVEEWAYETRPNTPILAGAIPTPESLAFGMGARPGNIRVAWQSEYGAAYQMQYKDSLATATWETVSMQIVATGNTAAAEIPSGGVSRYFRIVRAD